MHIYKLLQAGLNFDGLQRNRTIPRDKENVSSLCISKKRNKNRRLTHVDTSSVPKSEQDQAETCSEDGRTLKKVA